jgi:hypothetical protein
VSVQSGQGRSVPVGDGAGWGQSVPVGAGRCRYGAVYGSPRRRPVPTGAAAADRPQETLYNNLYTNRKPLSSLVEICCFQIFFE